MFGTALGPCPVTFVLEVLGSLILPLGSFSSIELHLLYKVIPLKARCGPDGG